MATIDEQRHQMIRRIVMRRQDSSADDMILLWQRLACELTAIIGQDGFFTLYSRAAHLARRSHPALPGATTVDFDTLKDYLSQQAPATAAEANIALLDVFIDTLILLIGEQLTATILHSAWGADTVDTAGKEPQS